MKRRELIKSALVAVGLGGTPSCSLFKQAPVTIASQLINLHTQQEKIRYAGLARNVLSFEYLTNDVLPMYYHKKAKEWFVFRPPFDPFVECIPDDNGDYVVLLPRFDKGIESGEDFALISLLKKMPKKYFLREKLSWKAILKCCDKMGSQIKNISMNPYIFDCLLETVPSFRARYNYENKRLYSSPEYLNCKEYANILTSCVIPCGKIYFSSEEKDAGVFCIGFDNRIGIGIPMLENNWRILEII